MSKNVLVDLSMDFSVEIVNMCETIKGKAALVNQLLRSGTSIGANITRPMTRRAKRISYQNYKSPSRNVMRVNIG